MNADALSCSGQVWQCAHVYGNFGEVPGHVHDLLMERLRLTVCLPGLL